MLVSPTIPSNLVSGVRTQLHHTWSDALANTLFDQYHTLHVRSNDLIEKYVLRKFSITTIHIGMFSASLGKLEAKDPPFGGFCFGKGLKEYPLIGINSTTIIY